MRARVPVPSSTASCSIRRTWRATVEGITRRRVTASCTSSPTWAISRGLTCTPSLATAQNAEAICRAVTAMPWPMGMLPIEEPDH